MGKPCTGLSLPCSYFHGRDSKHGRKRGKVMAVETVVCPRCECTYNYCPKCAGEFKRLGYCEPCYTQMWVSEAEPIHGRVKEKEVEDPDNPQEKKGRIPGFRMEDES